MIFKPMLAGEADLSRLEFPLYASVKLDGVRAIVRDGVVYSRNNKPIPNQYVQAAFKNFEHYDGELILGEPTAKDCYRQTVSAVMSNNAVNGANVRFHVFDHVGSLFAPYRQRYCLLKAAPFVTPLPQRLVHTIDELLAYELAELAAGHEGLIIREVDAPYKMGRSSTREGYLLKLKRFKDAEFTVVGFEERMHNGNEATVNELGRTARSSHQANMVGRGDLGALICQYGAMTFNVGTGFSDAERSEIWEHRHQLV